MSFDARGEPALLEAVAEAGELVICGCEAHVCVGQTVLSLRAQGRRVVVAADAMPAARARPSSREIALRRMAEHGAEIVTTEMILFEWLRSAEHPQVFRPVSKLNPLSPSVIDITERLPQTQDACDHNADVMSQGGTWRCTKPTAFGLNRQRRLGRPTGIWFTVGKRCDRHAYSFLSLFVIHWSLVRFAARALLLAPRRPFFAESEEVVVNCASLVSVFHARLAAALALVLCAPLLWPLPVSAALPPTDAWRWSSAIAPIPMYRNSPTRSATPRAIPAAPKRLGFEVVEGYDLKMEDMTAKVRQFAQKLDGAKAGLVYLSPATASPSATRTTSCRSTPR